MSQTLTITNPTSGSVDYVSRDCRITVPTGDSTHIVSEDAAKRITAVFKKHHPLLEVTALQKAEAGAPEAAEDEAPKAPAKQKAASRRKADTADATTKNEASAE
ncbi:hypothetical protein [Vreelandella alkaliphila]|uniref:Uncharacterized protein n=1 Tax=Vreelandella alkaliphila TaxID=272774 RepID=A0AAJ2VVI0_9GAMM|nr:hypothetical protein [Halomonas alkaliphila]MDX5979645.1 hypothetical protein [Halomonas alkaliphila]